jgi:hypothetical protein
MDMGEIAGSFGNYAKSGAFWLIIVVVICAAIIFFYGYMTRRSKLKYNCIELVRFGNGKIGANQMKAGVFKTKTFLMGLFDYGNESVMKVTDGRVIEKAKTTNLHEIFGKRGYVVMRSPKDSQILVPISKVDFDNLQAVFAIAPGDYRDASTRIYNEAIKETQGTWEKLLPYVAIGLCVVLTIINVVVNMQMTNHTTDKVGELLIQGCSNQQHGIPATGGAA